MNIKTMISSGKSSMPVFISIVFTKLLYRFVMVGVNSILFETKTWSEDRSGIYDCSKYYATATAY